MKISRNRTTGLIRRYASAALVVALIAGSVSLASFAEMGYTESNFGVNTQVGRSRAMATPSAALESLASSSDSNRLNQPSLPELLEQTADNEEVIDVNWFQVALNGKAIVDSDDWSVTIRPDRQIKQDAVVKHQIRVTLYPEEYAFEAGDSVTWNLGKIQGLSLDGEFYEQLLLDGGRVNAGDVYLYYTTDGDVILTTIFNEKINRYDWITITYWYDCGFIPVEEPTGIVFDLPGYEEPVPAILIPENWTGEPTTKEPTTEAPTTEEPTTEEPTSEEPTTEEPTTEEPTTEEPTTEPTTAAPTRGSGGSSSSDREDVTTKAATTAAETVPESQTETIPETETETESAEQPTGDQSPQDEQTENDTEEADDTESDEVVDINISFGAEVAASHGMQSQVLPNEILTYRMVLRNDSEEEIRDVRIRDYLPEHTSFIMAGDEGVYGVVDGRQYITWVLESIPPGEELELTFQVKVFPCTAPNYQIRNQVYWQGDDDRSINHQARPENEVDFPQITIG